MAVSTSKSQITYIVFAHPDDEYCAWALIHKSTGNYPVFCMLTRGEQTNYCPNPGDVPPEKDYAPLVPAAKDSANCKAARINSFRDFLHAMSTRDSTLEDPVRNPQVSGPRAGVAGFGTIDDRNYLLYAGSKCALLIFDLDDGDLQENEVQWAIESARAARSRGDLPQLPEYAVIAASYYWTGGGLGCRNYAHGDHFAVHQAIRNKAGGYFRPGWRWGATAVCGTRTGRTSRIDAATHEYAFVRNQSASSIGVFQKYYGWLYGVWPFHHYVHEPSSRVYEQRFWQIRDP